MKPYTFRVRAFAACLLLLILAFCSPAASAQAQPISDADAKAVRQVIEAQLDAFRHDDAARAFSYAAAGIREMFGSAEAFLKMVRTSYAVVYRPRNVVFEPPERVGEDLLQPVILSDADGRGWIALYPMRREKDGSWRINGCSIGRLGGQET